MKLLYEIASGHVLARYPDRPLDAQLAALSFAEPAEPAADSGNALIVVPDSVAIPHAVIRVVHAANSDPEFIIDQDAVAQQWRCVKEGRNQQLASSDWICSVSDFVHPKKEEFVVYRQALRDITQQSNPFQLVWPQSP